MDDEFDLCPECESERIAIHDVIGGWLICRDCDAVFRHAEDGGYELLDDEECGA